jgi:hypothetical protein
MFKPSEFHGKSPKEMLNKYPTDSGEVGGVCLGEVKIVN